MINALKWFAWEFIAYVVTIPFVRAWIIKRAMRTPYFHLEGYMRRWWLFNPTIRETKKRRWEWIPFSIRVHHILRADLDTHEHNHPWDARTIIMNGWYLEQRNNSSPRIAMRDVGYTGPIGATQFHRIREVSQGGVWTLFIMYKYKGDWGFRVKGKFIPYKQYENKRKES